MQPLVVPGFKAVSLGEVDIIIILPFNLLGCKINHGYIQALLCVFVIIAFFYISGTLVNSSGFIRID